MTLSVQFSLFFKRLSWSELRGPSWVWKEHHQQTRMLAGPGHKPLCRLPHGSSSAPFGLLSPTLSKFRGPASMGGFGSSALIEYGSGLFSDGHTVPIWSGPWAELWFEHHLTQASKDQICAKERSSIGVRAGRWQPRVGEWRTSQKGQGIEGEAATERYHGRKRRVQK